jgi:LPS sulfotransferase NodH
MPSSAPSRGYLICSEFRSGSTLLCRWLASTGRLGRPDEPFRDNALAARLDRDPALLDRLLDEATTDNGVYGIKLFSRQFDATMKARWVERLPGLAFIHLERRDLLGQAISLMRALQTGQYESSQARLAAPRYDRDEIERQIGLIAQGQARWKSYFARNGIAPLWLVYEDMVSDPEGTVRRVAAHVGVAEPVALDPAGIDVGVQRDEISEAWRERFIRESADLGRLEHPRGRARIWLRRAARDVWYLAHLLSGRR